VSDEPFTEPKEHIGGYCMPQVKSNEEAIEWASRFATVLRDAKVIDRDSPAVRAVGLRSRVARLHLHE
jgi:hypothetical protein